MRPATRAWWQTWALGASLLLNVGVGGYVAYRLLRTPPSAGQLGEEVYRADRRLLFEELARTRAQVVMLGDSLTDRGEWHELLGRADVANRGIAGETIRGATARLAAISSLDPQVIVVMLGTNDLLAGRSVAECGADHDALLDALREAMPRARILLQSVLPVRDRSGPDGVEPEAIVSLNQRLNGACKAGRCTYVDVHAEVATSDGTLDPTLTTDGVHLNGKGYLRWRDAVLRALAEPRR